MWVLFLVPKATITDKSMDMPVENRTDPEVAALAGGCFWCIEAIFQELNGVIKAQNPAFQEVICQTDL